MSELTPLQILWLESQPGHWQGRAQTRRREADRLRESNEGRAADYCDEVAKQYEARAAEAMAATGARA